MEGLTRLIVRGHKLIRELDLELRSLTALLGANGVGKSNLLSLPEWHALPGDGLDVWVAGEGGLRSPPLRAEGDADD